ncbi:sensor histidine kinase [Hymenobacter weizhouensis]|uniref:sensor histidine kinase n=1 Tax=Hymenobacter sp. YIM 151500-1 TaxID=2987689 RepID=UPI002227DEC1|nr:hybrid sensor histidine kinase/response regulator [Hymenobacter sp. YIM 151500-1]UYZ61556.1 hybrid sensor histidine kinase/response regulator [Hymenobacter sp. YIM 151500-1]
MKKILLVDDSEHDRALYRRYLSKHTGFERLEISEASSGAEACAQFAVLRPDCVLLDYNLPDTDGLHLLAELLKLAPPDSLCAVMITGAGSEVLAVRALNSGALDYLVKQQFDHELLFKTVWHAIEKNEWRQYVASYHEKLRGVNQQLRDSLEKLTEARQEVDHKNNQLTAANAELARTNAQLARTNLDLDNFVYAASHDLKQPVNNLQGLFEELRRTAIIHDPDAAYVFGLVDTSLRDLSTTINDLAAVVAADRSVNGPAPEPVLLADLVAEILAVLGPQVEATQAQVRTDFTALPELTYVRIHLRTILLNLLGNALKYRHPDRPPHVQLRACCEAGRPVLEVQDNGLGIDLDRHGAELFQLFRRFHTQAASGTGVGLFLVNRLVEAHGGHIDVTSELGTGTIFRLYLG